MQSWKTQGSGEYCYAYSDSIQVICTQIISFNTRLWHYQIACNFYREQHQGDCTHKMNLSLGTTVIINKIFIATNVQI